MTRNIAQNTEASASLAQKNFVRGDSVLAKDYQGRDLRRRVWAVGESVVYLCSDQTFANLAGGLAQGWPIGFPKRDVRLADKPPH